MNYNKKNVFWIFAVIYIIILAMIYSTNIIPEGNRLSMQEILFLIAPLVAVVAGFIAFRKFGFKTVQGKAIFLLTLGFLSSLLAEIIWDFFEIVLKIKPTPSIADFFYLLAYPFYIWAIISALDIGKIEWTKKKILFTVIPFILLALITFYFEIYGGYESYEPLLKNIITVSYGIADMVVLIMLLLMINLSQNFKGGMLERFWILFAIGFIFLWIGDIIYAVYFDQYNTPTWFYRQIDYLWILQYIICAYAFIHLSGSIDDMKKNISTFIKKNKH